MGEGVTPFPYAMIYPQDEHEQLLIARLMTLGVRVEREVSFEGFENAADSVRVRLRSADGVEESQEARYLAGCDGAHSTVRAALQAPFPGGVYEHLFYVADVVARGAVMNGEIHVALDASDFLAVFPLLDTGRARLIGTVRDEAVRTDAQLTWDGVSGRAIEWLGVDVERVHWFSTYRVHHRVAETFRRARVFLVGDAAHIHSPVGGQGMNTGIGDAVNLAWKLAAVVRGDADASVLDSYEPERIAFARRLVSTTDRAFTAVTSHGAVARALRLQIVPRLVPSLFAFRSIRRLMFRTVSQTAINYRTSRLSAGRAGDVHGGDRLPWLAGSESELDNFAPLASLDWQLHVYGEATNDTVQLCQERQLPLHVFRWRPEARRAGLSQNAVYLVRPDGYIALAEQEGRAATIAAYLDAHKIRVRVAD
jgi:2-polyprenyl-6-methoxyphenol hydroxylase-like FAD-dependent oxidoreductase